MKDEIFQEILETVFPILPDDWSRFIIRGIYTQNGNEIKILVNDSSNTYRDCFALGIPNEEVMQICKSIHEKLIQLRQSAEKELWSGITIVIDNEGNFTSDFDYSDVELFSPEYNSAWENRYLK